MSHCTTHSKQRVLLVSEHEERRSKLSEALVDAGYTTDMAGSILEAMTAAQLRDYAVVVTELRLSGTDGYTLFNRLSHSQPTASFIMLSELPELDCGTQSHSDQRIVAVLGHDCTANQLVTAIQVACYGHLQRTSQPPKPPSAPPVGLTILIVEDNQGDAEILLRYLNKAFKEDHHQYLIAESLNEARRTLAQEKVHLIFSDLSLPDSRGLDTVSQLQRVAKDSALVVLTGNEDDEMGAQAIQQGAQDYLHKNEIDQRVLKRTVRYAIERLRTQQRLSHVAYYDTLTGLANRITFRERLTQLVDRAKRNQQHFSVMFIDLDRFKSINDTYGHEVGDQVLTQVADRLKRATRSYDTVARLGGDEFAILLDDAAELVDPQQIAQRIVSEMSVPVMFDDIELVVTASVGIAAYPQGGATIDEMLRGADTAMYEAKAGGRNRYHVSSTELQTVMPVQRMHNDMRRAVAAREFFLHYQPQINLHTGQMVGLEALIRWRKPDGSTGMPDEFIPHLEDTGLIREAGAWALQAACSQLAALQMPPLDQARIAVNLSAHQLNADLPKAVQQALQETGVAPERLELEITESVLMRDTNATNNALDALRDMGVRIAIDDFGTGYSSLSYLQRFRVNTLKIDKSFVRTVPESRNGHIMVAAIIGLAHKLGLEIIAEGIETWHQLDFLRREGCDVGQGYLIARPSDIQQCVPAAATAH